MFNYLDNRTSMSVSLTESIFAGGKGFTMYKSICSALGEAFERFMACLEFFEVKNELCTESFNDIINRNELAMSPEELSVFDDEQFNDDSFVFDKFEKDSPISWFKMRDLFTEEDVYVPTCMIQMFYIPQKKDGVEEKRIGYSTSGGLTSHFTAQEGISHGLQETIERHEINLSWYCKIPPKRIIIDSVTNKQLANYLEYIEENDIHFFRHNH